ncbi:hypothetical protein FRC08_015821, partial [Ceratobasidium sp. 394]
LVKEPTKRATYAELLEHPWLVADRTREVDMPGWVAAAVAYRDAKRMQGGEISSSEDTVPDRATVEAAVKAGKVITVPENAPVNGVAPTEPSPNGVDGLADGVENLSVQDGAQDGAAVDENTSTP